MIISHVQMISAEDCQSCLEARVSLADSEVVYGEWGDSKPL